MKLGEILQMAKKYYHLQEKSKSSVQASKQLRNMREQSDHPDQKNQTKQPNQTVLLSAQACFRGRSPQKIPLYDPLVKSKPVQIVLVN